MRTSCTNIFRSIFLYCIINITNTINAQTVFLSEDFNLVSCTDLAESNDWALGLFETNRAAISDTGLFCHDRTSTKEEKVNNHYIELPKFISSNMVLQRETPLKFNGWGSEGDTVKVILNRQGIIFSDSVVIDQNGRWSLKLPNQQISSIPCTLEFGILNKPKTWQTIDNVLVGDVWFAGYI